jgi:hypothetical protein
MTALLAFLEPLLRAAREAKSDDVDADAGDNALQEDMDADDAEDQDEEEEEAGE